MIVYYIDIHTIVIDNSNFSLKIYFTNKRVGVFFQNGIGALLGAYGNCLSSYKTNFNHYFTDPTRKLKFLMAFSQNRIFKKLSTAHFQI